MLSLITIISFGVTLGFGIFYLAVFILKCKGRKFKTLPSISVHLTIISGIIAVILFVLWLFMSAIYSDVHNVNEKIKIYEEENIKIEKQIKDIVTNYFLCNENNKININDDYMSLAISIESLSSNKSVQQMLNTHSENINQIKHLQLQKADYKQVEVLLFYNN